MASGGDVFGGRSSLEPMRKLSSGMPGLGGGARPAAMVLPAERTTITTRQPYSVPSSVPVAAPHVTSVTFADPTGGRPSLQTTPAIPLVPASAPVQQRPSVWPPVSQEGPVSVGGFVVPKPLKKKSEFTTVLDRPPPSALGDAPVDAATPVPLRGGALDFGIARKSIAAERDFGVTLSVTHSDEHPQAAPVDSLPRQDRRRTTYFKEDLRHVPSSPYQVGSGPAGYSTEVTRVSSLAQAAPAVTAVPSATLREQQMQEQRERIEKEVREKMERERMERELVEREERERAARLELEQANREKLERETRERMEAEMRERVERETRERLTREQEERIAREEQDRLAREVERLTREQQERAEREARGAQEAAERAQHETRERIERETRERIEAEMRQKIESETRMRIEQEQRERMEREAREAQKRDEFEREMRERIEREMREKYGASAAPVADATPWSTTPMSHGTAQPPVSTDSRIMGAMTSDPSSTEVVAVPSLGKTKVEEPAKDLGPPFPGFVPTPGFEQGRWEYIVVDPTGIRLRQTPNYSKKEKAGGELVYGDVIWVCERGRLPVPGSSYEYDIMWLCLSNGRGWAFERTNRRRMSEVVYNQIEEVYLEGPLQVSPRVHAPLVLQSSPVPEIKTTSAKPTGCGIMLPGAEVRVIKQAIVMVQHPTKKMADVSKTLLRIESTQGGVAGMDHTIGWIQAELNFERLDKEERVLAKKKHERIHPRWLSVLATAGVSTRHLPGGISGAGDAGKLAAGELVQAIEISNCDGVNFYRLTDGNWVREVGYQGSKQVDIITREEHRWFYICDDKSGTAIRHMPTRCTNQNTGKELKHRQRVVVSELVKFTDGDEFLHLSTPNSGWVPMTKKGGGKKMQKLQPVPGGGAPPPGPQLNMQPGPPCGMVPMPAHGQGMAGGPPGGPAGFGPPPSGWGGAPAPPMQMPPQSGMMMPPPSTGPGYGGGFGGGGASDFGIGGGGGARPGPMGGPPPSWGGPGMGGPGMGGPGMGGPGMGGPGMGGPCMGPPGSRMGPPGGFGGPPCGGPSRAPPASWGGGGGGCDFGI
eukprot:TRINITY_DN5580_c0_g1_i3.p1 TRINITY_DN5580_c0_g1~~TRINITY_DN5580_c0_g1_i3.p1  ORF type:complete len:1076 (+),score=202.65 TRINITY_DN5580_c0_g1_i3:64-3228(+)